MSTTAPRVFVSYSHDSEPHRERVLALANRLRREGIDAQLDRYAPHPPEGWPRWMQRQIEAADYILLVCTETFRRRFDGREEPGKGRGVSWEGLLAVQLLYENGTRNEKLIPLLFAGSGETDIPLPLRPYTHYRLPDGYEGLYRQLTGQPEVSPPALGSVRPLNEQPEVSPPALGSVRPLSPQSNGIADSAAGPISPFMPGVIIERSEDFIGRHRLLDELRHAIHHHQPIQLLGEARMGKSSLLAQVALQLVPPDMRVAKIHARGRSGWSPRELVLAVADALGQRDSVERVMDGASRAGDEVAAVADGLQLLMPCALLVDDADAIAEGGHRFSSAFFDECRALTQARQLLWISASRRDLQSLFAETGLTSEFLNDSRRVVVGHMDQDDAHQLLRVLGSEAAAHAYQLAAGWPQGLQWLGDRLWRDGRLAAIGDDFANAMEQNFCSWWKLRSQAERSLLRRLLAPTPVSELSSAERKRARKLVSRGLLREWDEVFSLPGAAWAQWVRDAE